MPLLQVKTINGLLMEGASWEINDILNLREGHRISISIDVDKENESIIEFLRKHSTSDCHLERRGENIDDGYYAVLTFQIMGFSHMLETEKNDLTSMAYMVPMDRTVENVLAYMYDKTKCNPRFEDILKKL